MPLISGLPAASRKTTPIAWAAPQPPSTVADPPAPTMISRAPAFIAATMSWPVP